MEKKSIDDIMKEMPDFWKSRWCESGFCGCLGCANNSGGLRKEGYTKEDWEDYLKRKGMTIDV